MGKNPFTPSFGVAPPILAGREALLDLFTESLDGGPGSPGRSTIISGQRGCGKTCLLSESEDLARQRGWLVVSETATPGLLHRLTATHLPALLAEHGTSASKRSLSGVSAAGLGSVNWTTAPRYSVKETFRSYLTELSAALAAHGTGVLLTIDEVNGELRGDLREISATVQHAFREGLEVSLLLSGLPSAVDQLLNDDALTFLRRSEKHILGAVSHTEAVRALAEPIAHSGRAIDHDEVERAAAATGGYPFMLQLVGYHMFRQSPANDRISSTDVDAGIAAAQDRLGRALFQPALAELSHKDREFLLAMAQDDGPSKISDLAKRTRSSNNTANRYRARLLASQLVSATGHGEVDLALPRLREHLRENH